MGKTLLLLTILIFTACQKETKQLSFNLTSETPRHYFLQTKLQLISGDSESSFFSEAQIYFTKSLLSAFDDKTSRFLIGIDSIDFRSNQYTVEECRHIEHYLLSQKSEFKINPYGEIKDFEKNNAADEMEVSGFNLANILLKIQPSLPRHETYIGDTWEKQLKIPTGENRSNYLYKWFKVNDIYSNGDQSFAKILTTLKYKIEESALMIAEDNFILGQGSLVFNIDDGDLEFGNFDISGTVSLKIANKLFPNYQIIQSVTLQRVP
ncbi:MAG: hypothetical protein OCC49_06865 [Fibrobacterales bacterium]